jgi:hypothetical protein
MLSRNLQEAKDRFCYVVQDNCVINNGHMSKFFSLERGCPQGDPLSPYLFIIGVELLSLKLKTNQDIHGIIINEVESLTFSKSTRSKRPVLLCCSR